MLSVFSSFPVEKKQPSLTMNYEQIRAILIFFVTYKFKYSFISKFFITTVRLVNECDFILVPE